MIPGDAGEAEARARLESLFAGFDRLTPFELERIGLQRPYGDAHEALLRRVEEAARATDRSILLHEARGRARETVLGRFSEGGLHPTWVGLNWGISQGTIEDRVAIVEALEDAAAAAVVADVVAPEIAEALALDAGLLADMAAGEVSEGALGRVLAPPAPGLRDPWSRRAAIVVAALVVASAGYAVAAAAAGTAAGLAVGVVAIGLVVALARRGPGDEG